MKDHPYLSGFGNEQASEAVAGTLPLFRNSPQQVAHGLYAEQINGTAFTVPRAKNKRSWLYRIHPSVKQSSYRPYRCKNFVMDISDEFAPTALRWSPLPTPKKKLDFIDGLIPFAFNGHPANHQGGGIYLYACNQSMQQKFLTNADAEMIIVPQIGGLLLKTEMGLLQIHPDEIAVIPRGIKFQVFLLSDNARGYLCENYGQAFTLPELGPIGANGLANPRDFLCPTAYYEHKQEKNILVTKFQQNLWQCDIEHSPLDVVAWHGNHYPYKYDLKHFNTINTVSFDHPDPSIFTVLTSPSATPGVANIDFVIFPPRWMVAENTFRPPYYHRNVMSEFMGLIRGVYDAKENGFVPGGASLHNGMTPHGPDKNAFEKACHEELKPRYYHDILAFMWESVYVWRPTKFAMKSDLLQSDYLNCWQNLEVLWDV